MNRRKLIGLVAALLVAGLGTMFVLNSSNKPAPAPVAAPEAMVKVLKVTKAVPKGTPVAQLTEFVTQVDVPASQQQANTATSLDDLVDKTMVANAELLEGDQVSKLRFESAQKLSTTDIVSSGGGEAEDLTSLVGVWVNLTPLNALNGNLKPGVTKVAVFAAFEPIPGLGADPTKDVSTMHIIAHKVPVLDMYPPQYIPVAAPAGGDQAAAAAPPLPASIQVKLGVDAATAERIMFTQLKGTLVLGDEGLAADESGTKVVERGNIYEPTQTATVKSATSPKPVTAGSDPLSAGTAKPVAGANPSSTVKPAAAVAPKTVKPVAPTPVAGTPAVALASSNGSGGAATPAVVTPSTVAK